MRLTIRKVRNGFILVIPPEDNDMYGDNDEFIFATLQSLLDDLTTRLS